MREEDNNYINNQNYYNVQRSFYDSFSNGYQPLEKKKNYKKIIVPIVVLLLIISSFFVIKKVLCGTNKKERTFMIYMVGSDLESKSSQGTYSIEDIVGKNIDLRHNNIILMVGGAEKWHNFVKKDEIGIYELTSNGFKKKKQLPVENMGASSTLESFLDYSYEEYPAEKYEMIFWNHGLGAIGIEQDELSKDFLTISELNNAFRNSAFNEEKLELTIFYNCLASNLHIANIMKNYSEYMVASEEVFYLSKALNRLKFLENIEKEDTAFDIGYSFIEQSDKVVKEYNNSHSKKIDSTLSIIDLSEIDTLNRKLNNFIKTIDLNENYYDISNYRRNTHTYGISQTYDYDTIDLYKLVEYLGILTNNQNLSKDVLNEINNTVKYTSNLNNYSKGLSIYFPYFGKESSIETHLSLFGKIFNDNYYSFINDFYQVRTGAKQTRRSVRNGSFNKLVNSVIKNDVISIELTEEEKNNYQGANIYIFSKNNDKYSLLLKSSELELVGNKLQFLNNKILKVNNNGVSYFDGIIYGKLSNNIDELNTKFTIEDNKIVETILDSNEYISSSIVEIDDYNDIYFAKVNYKLFENGLFNEDFEEEKELEYFKIDKNDMNISYNDNSENEYYVLIEMKDIYNDSYYSNLGLIK